MTSIKRMLFGIGLILLGIFGRVMGVDYNYSRIWVHYLPIAEVILGMIFLGLGMFYDED